MTALLAGLAFGVFGSGHCAVMCGPLAALAVSKGSSLGYHGGRMLAYLCLGLLAGVIGAGASSAGAERWLSVVAGVSLLGLAAGRLKVIGRVGVGGRALTSLLTRLGRSGRDSRSPTIVFGVLNGLLPCGLVYAAVIGAAGFGSLTAALLFLAGFGAGTIPFLAVSGAFGQALMTRLPVNARQGASMALALVGLLLILRGAIPVHMLASDASGAVHHPDQSVASH